MANEPNTTTTTTTTTTDDFEERLKKKFVDLVAKMNQPGFAEALDRELFGDTETLINAYRPDETATGGQSSP